MDEGRFTVDRAVDARRVTDSAGKAKGIAKGIKSNTVNWPKGEHAMQRLLDRGITREQADKVLNTGRKFYDAKTESIVVFAERTAINGGKGKTKLIGVAIDPATKNVKTVIRESRSFEKLPTRFIEVTQ